MSAFERARLESEALLKALGGTPEPLDSGRRTRSSNRPPVTPSPKPEKPKRKQPATPRATKKLKLTETPIDEIDAASSQDDESSKETLNVIICFYFYRI